MGSLFVRVMIKSVYGSTYYYPNCWASEIFAKISRKKTISREDLDLIKDLGYEVMYSPYETKPLKDFGYKVMSLPYELKPHD